ncbi:hypothetical protein Aduo_015420 [Ancylostoma duodenale]
MRCDKSPIPLPSGLYLLPTKLGPIVSGKAKSTTSQSGQPITLQTIQVSPCANDINNWDRNWSMDEDKAGTEEFGNTEKEVRATLDKRVWQYFNETIQRREDGYYVRLPWKEQYQHLPNNKALAHKRLVNVWTSLRKDKNILDQYNKVEEQLQQKLIEVVDETAPAQGGQVHYIPYQPVFTPHKATTKLCIFGYVASQDNPAEPDCIHKAVQAAVEEAVEEGPAKTKKRRRLVSNTRDQDIKALEKDLDDLRYGFTYLPRRKIGDVALIGCDGNV